MKQETRFCRLYLLTPEQIDLETFPALLQEVLQAGDVACLQIRLRDIEGNQVDDDVMRAAVAALRPICHDHDIAVLLDANPRLVEETGADGIHVKFGDADIAELRTEMGDDFMIGVACLNSRHNAMEAAEQGADYVSFGPFFETHTAPEVELADRDHLTWWQSMMEVPVVAIGGVTPDNALEMAQAGADFVAAIGGVWRADNGPAAAVDAFNRILEQPLISE